jgi:CheY-like chemotaxis protein
MFEAAPDVQIIGEAADGLVAVDKAIELRPDLILLDVGLPGQNGIEAARRIVQIAPNSKILFLSQESSRDIVRAALSAGAMGYVVKIDAAKDLMSAVHAVMRGKRFVGSRFAAYDLPLGTVADMQHVDVAQLCPETMDVAFPHAAHFYSDDESLLDAFARFVSAAIGCGDAAIVLMTPAHRTSLRARLLALGVDIESAMKSGRYVSLDVAAALSMFIVDDIPSPVQFHRTVGDLIKSTANTAPNGRVAACGECAPLLWEEGKAPAAIHLEQLWSEVGKLYGVNILCAYRLGSFQGGVGSHIFEKICALHSPLSSR